VVAAGSSRRPSPPPQLEGSDFAKPENSTAGTKEAGSWRASLPARELKPVRDSPSLHGSVLISGGRDGFVSANVCAFQTPGAA